MSILLQVQSGTKRFGARTLFDQASMAVEDGEHIGVIGPNGAGKTTLFKILVGRESLDEGQVTKSQSLRLGYLEQEERIEPRESVEDYLVRRSGHPIWELYKLGFGLGLKEEMFAAPISSLSGGFRMRCQLLAQLAMQPNLLLLDEPTNYLDLESLLVLEEFLVDYRGAFLLISHDREFLRRVTDHTLEIEQGEFTKFNGHIDDYFEQKALIEEQLRKQSIAVENRRKEIIDFAKRFGAKASKAKQVQSRLKTLNKLDEVEIKSLPVQAKIRIPEPVRTGKQVVNFANVHLGYGEKAVLRNIDFQLLRGGHLAVVGENGAGKSTFLKAIAKILEPQKGQIHWGPNVEIGYYSQHVAENLKLDQTVYEALAEVAHKDLVPQNLRDLAGQLLFSDERIDQKLTKMSGGEKARVALGRVLVKRAPLLVMDEPTNHLDFHTVEALTQALRDYKGSVIVVSHDRSFIQRIASQILLIQNGEAHFYPGTYAEYVWSLQNGMLAGAESKPTPPDETPKVKSSKNQISKEDRKKIRAQLREKNQRLKYLERKLKELTKSFETDSAELSQLQGEKAQELMMDLAYRQKTLNELEEEWLETQEEIEQLERSTSDSGSRTN